MPLRPRGDAVIEVFKSDELKLITVKPHWTPSELLDKEGIVYLKDIVRPLGLDPFRIITKVHEIREQEKVAYKVLGIGKLWGRWIVRMKVFSDYYRAHGSLGISHIRRDWDGNILLEQKGIFLLTEVCQLIPFTVRQLRYRAQKNPRSRGEYGIWKDNELNKFLVDMGLFSSWIIHIWQQEVIGGEPDEGAAS